jgi:hypothetical protein
MSLKTSATHSKQVWDQSIKANDAKKTATVSNFGFKFKP